ncbi:MAG TPA: GNAT family N-acetyltransferase [Pseudonocardiaceae bacterium]|nr:GNAT family N-acetyltransferase [Pseudonocardiaceae bacterium]
MTPGRPDVAFVASTDLDDTVLTPFYQDILQPAFPADELISLDEFRTGYGSPSPVYHGTLALRGDEPVGGALGEYDPGSGLMLLAYLAIREDQRGTGLGTGLLNEVLPAWRAALTPTATIAEVEDPRFYRAGPHGDPVARLRFYERLGSTVLPLPYFQPALRPDVSRVRGMFLICLDPGRTGVSAAALATFMDEYVGLCEGPAARDADPEYRAFRDQITAWPDEVPLWPMSAADQVPVTSYAAPLS